MQVKTPDAGTAPETQTDWHRLRTMTDADVAEAAASDPDSAPILPLEQIRREYKPAPPRIRR